MPTVIYTSGFLIISADDRTTQFYPNKHNPRTLIPFSQAHGKPFTIPFKAIKNLENQTGNERLKIFVADEKFEIDGESKEVNGLVTFQTSKVFNTRGGLALKGGFGLTSSGKASTEPKISKTAFQMEVGYVLK